MTICLCLKTFRLKHNSSPIYITRIATNCLVCVLQTCCVWNYFIIAFEHIFFPLHVLRPGLWSGVKDLYNVHVQRLIAQFQAPYEFLGCINWSGLKWRNPLANIVCCILQLFALSSSYFNKKKRAALEHSHHICCLTVPSDKLSCFK